MIDNTTTTAESQTIGDAAPEPTTAPVTTKRLLSLSYAEDNNKVVASATVIIRDGKFAVHFSDSDAPALPVESIDEAVAVIGDFYRAKLGEVVA